VRRDDTIAFRLFSPDVGAERHVHNGRPALSGWVTEREGARYVVGRGRDLSTRGDCSSPRVRRCACRSGYGGWRAVWASPSRMKCGS